MATTTLALTLFQTYRKVRIYRPKQKMHSLCYKDGKPFHHVKPTEPNDKFSQNRKV